MTGSKYKHLSTVLCIILATSFISDVTAKSYKPSKHTSSHSHSGSHSVTHNTHQASHKYPSHSSSPGSGNGGGLTQHKYPSSHTYPSTNHLSGTGSKPLGSVSYPPSPGLSGGSHHLSGGSSHGTGSKPTGSVSYPPSPGLSGGRQNLSGGSSYGTGSKPSGSVSYPPSSGMSGGSQNLPGGSSYGTGSKQSGSVLYPPSSGMSGGSQNLPGGSSYGTGSKPSGSVSYPPSPGLSGGGHHGNNHLSGGTNHHQHVVHHHHYNYNYNYRPPSVIYYHTSHGSVSYPVYTGALPLYVYDYRSSKNKYRYLLAGLALYNLGRMSSDIRMREYHKHYVPQGDERCIFGVRYSSGQYEEMKVDCRSITYFIYEMQTPPQIPQQQVSTNVVTTNVVTSVVQQNQTLLPNGTVIVPAGPNVQQQVNGVAVPNTQQILSADGTLVSNQQVNTVTTTTTKVMSVTDPTLSGSRVHLENGMQCYVARRTTFTNVNKPVPCDLLQSYAKQSFYKRNMDTKLKSSLTLLITAVVFVLCNVN